MMAGTLPAIEAICVLRRERSGSSSPVVVDTTRGQWFAKLRGAAQGIPPLIAELVVAELAERLQLAVPERALVTLSPNIVSNDVNDELRDLLDASVGVNVGFSLLDGARNIEPADFQRVPLEIAARVLWLDTLVQNLDRTISNPNIMVRRGTYWLIDHGAALPFQHDWSAVQEHSAQRSYDMSRHVFGWAAPVLRSAHEQFAHVITREAVHDAVAMVPDEYLATFGGDTTRRRAMYAAYLWKRRQWMDTLGGD